MGRAQPKRRGNSRQKGASRGLPGWAMMTIGLIIGLFVAFLVYLDDLDTPPATSVERPSGNASPEQRNGEAPSSADKGGDEDGSPRFEFYSILPELEVVVPDGGKDKGDATTQGGESSEEPPPAPEDGATYYLQAGSFQKPEQADRMKARIALIGLDVEIENVKISGARWHRVRVGPYTDPSDLQAAQKRLRDNDIDYLVTRRKSSG